MAYFPFMIEISGKQCLVAGGGRLALHKVSILLNFGVRIKVVGEEICPELWDLGELQIIQREFEEGDIVGADFVVAATDDAALNERIADLCRQKDILVNAVDQKEACSFIFPALIQEKNLLISVSTGGNSPAAAAYVKRKLKSHIPAYYGDMVETLSEYRDYILEYIDSAEQRKEIFNRLLEYGDAHEGEIPKNVVNDVIQRMCEKKQD